MRLFSKILFALLIFNLCLSGGLHVLATQNPNSLSLLLPDQSCPAPCWYGINTDTLDHAATVEKIMTLPQAQGLIEWSFQMDGQEQRLRLENGRDIYLSPQNMRVGDLIRLMGLADHQTKGSAYDGQNSYQYLQFFYAEARFVATVLLPYGNERLRPSTPIRQLIYPTGPFETHESAHPWQGFVWLESGYPFFGYAPALQIR